MKKHSAINKPKRFIGNLWVLIALAFMGCEIVEEPESFDFLSEPLVHAELGIELDEPQIVLNELAKGELDRHITSVIKQMFDNFPEPTERLWQFEYVNDSDKVSVMTYFHPHYSCEKNNYQFHYNSRGLIDSVISIRKNKCNLFEVKKSYTFNYNENGLLKSIFMENEFFFEENYFGYYSNGKIKEIYTAHHSRGEEIIFGVQKFYYDPSFRNVIKADNSRGTSHMVYEYFYDDRENPFKDFFVAGSVQLPHIGPAYLSENNVVRMIKHYPNSPHNKKIPLEYLFNYSDNGELQTYSDKEEEKFPYILFSVNK